jgi:hypothetical protein
MVGGGQEINIGEAGLAEWGRALVNYHKNLIVRASPAVLPGGEERPGGWLFDEIPEGVIVQQEPRLHLTMNVRSPRAERLNSWVDALLNLDIETARQNLPPREFPLVATRDLRAMKEWLRERSGTDDRPGLVIGSGGRRLRAWGLETDILRRESGWAHWFLAGPGDVRSSFQLEVPATNFDCQGLELDWVGVCWSNDFIPLPNFDGWRTRRFLGSKWTTPNEETRRHILNSYRVLLTRARRGQILWVPRPEGGDATLDPEHFDSIWRLLLASGVEPLE